MKFVVETVVHYTIGELQYCCHSIREFLVYSCKIDAAKKTVRHVMRNSDPIVLFCPFCGKSIRWEEERKR